MDTLLKFITLDKLGVSLQHISEPSTTAQAIESITQLEQVEDDHQKETEATKEADVDTGTVTK
jgi:hypothetical protein